MEMVWLHGLTGDLTSPNHYSGSLLIQTALYSSFQISEFHRTL